jgi:hypothetical protein
MLLRYIKPLPMASDAELALALLVATGSGGRGTDGGGARSGGRPLLVIKGTSMLSGLKGLLGAKVIMLARCNARVACWFLVDGTKEALAE